MPVYLRQRLRDLERLSGSPGRLLDVGAGAGAFARLASRRGWSVLATEFGDAAHELNRPGDLDVVAGDLTQLLLPGGFDVVHMNHVLEHLQDPPGNLRRAYELLRPGGILLVEVPYEFADLVFLTRRALHRAYCYSVPTQHLWFFTPETLKRLVCLAGFHLLRLRTLRRSPSAGLRGAARTAIGCLERLIGRAPLIELVAHRP